MNNKWVIFPELCEGCIFFTGDLLVALNASKLQPLIFLNQPLKCIFCGRFQNDFLLSYFLD